MKPHQIRLAGPWEWKWVSVREGSSSDSRSPCQLPFDVPTNISDDVDASAGVMLFRRFHCPTGIEIGTTVRVVAESTNADIQFILNQSVIAPEQPDVLKSRDHEKTGEQLPGQTVCDITRVLKPFNELQVMLTPTNQHSSPRLTAVSLMISECE
jgi:hypothetical protein